MECTVKWVDGMSFVAETGSGHVLNMDGAPDGGEAGFDGVELMITQDRLSQDPHRMAAVAISPRAPWKPCSPAPVAARPMTSS